MNTDDEKLPMDDMEGTPPSAPEANDEPQDQPQAQPRERDEQGKFKAAGEPNGEAQARRERQERDEARKEAAEARAAHAALQKRFDDMAALAKGDEPAPDGDSDPLKPIAEQLNTLNQRFEQQDQQKQQEETHRQVLAYADQDEAAFREKAPDFPNAIQHYINSRLTEMKALGVDQAQAEQVLADEANRLLYQSAQTGRSAAETIYAMAQARGYSPGQQAYTPPQQAPQNFGGRSLGNGQGAGPAAMSAQAIAGMSEEDYMAFRATPEGRRAIQRAMGG